MADHIQIGDISPRIQYTGDGSQTVFTYPFPIFAAADMEVYLDQVKQSTGFTVNGAGQSAGGDVTFTTAPASSVLVTLRRRLAIQRTSDFQESGEFRSKVINDELDYLTAALQQVDDDVDRSLRLGATDTAAALTLPDAAMRASKILSFDSSGDPTVSDPIVLPASLTGNGLSYTRVNSGETAYEFRTPAQVLTDIGAQASDGTLTALAGVTVAADEMIYATGADAFATASLTSFARAILDDANAAAARTTLGLVIGTDVQAWDAQLDALSALTDAEVTQLLNINTSAISAVEWGYLATFNQALATTDNVTFNNIAGTLTTAAQPNVTSLGTLTTLTVDNITINGNTLSSTSGAININPAGGQSVVIDSVLDIDGAVMGYTGVFTVTGSAVVDNITINGAAITSDTGAIAFGDETIHTTGKAFFGVGGDATGRTAGGIGGQVQIQSTNTQTMSFSAFSNTASPGPQLGFGASRGTTVGAYNGVQSGDNITKFFFGIADGTDTKSIGAQITVVASKTATSNDVGAHFDILTSSSGAAVAFRTRFEADGNLLLNTTNVPASSVGNLILGNGTPPTAGATNAVCLYSEDVSASAELKVMDEADNITTLSPHNFSLYRPAAADPFPWSYYSRNEFLGKEINVDLSGAIREIEALSGKKFIHIADVPKRNWATEKQARIDSERENKILLLTGEGKTRTQAETLVPASTPKAPPAWLAERGVA